MTIALTESNFHKVASLRAEMYSEDVNSCVCLCKLEAIFTASDVMSTYSGIKTRKSCLNS
jgi:hypothetical protein